MLGERNALKLKVYLKRRCSFVWINYVASMNLDERIEHISSIGLLPI